jgi:type II secretory pathway component PulF
MTPSPSDKQIFYTEMAKLLEAGFGIRKAAAVLHDIGLPPAQAVMLEGLNRGLDQGDSIAMAFSRNTAVITELERRILTAGERGGKLGLAFLHLAEYFALIASARREIIQSMIYPVFILHLGVFIAVVPDALMRGDASLAEIGGSLLARLCLLYLAALITYLGIRSLAKKARTHALIDRFILALPWIGKARRHLAMARFCKVFHASLLAGLSMKETAEAAAQASLSGRIRQAGEALASCAQARQPLGPSFIEDEVFPKSFARSYATGEEAGTLDKDLARWSKLFQEDAETAVKALAANLPKVLYFAILGWVAWKIISFYTGYYSGLLDQIGA